MLRRRAESLVSIADTLHELTGILGCEHALDRDHRALFERTIRLLRRLVASLDR